MQAGEGKKRRAEEEEAAAQNIEVLSNTTRLYRRFHLEGRNIILRIQSPPANQDPLTWLRTTLESIFRLVTVNRSPTDRIGIALHSDSFREGPVGLSFRPISNFSVYDLWGIVNRVIRSSADFVLNETLAVSAASVT